MEFSLLSSSQTGNVQPTAPGLHFSPQKLIGMGRAKVWDLRLIGSDRGTCPSLNLSLGIGKDGLTRNGPHAHLCVPKKVLAIPKGCGLMQWEILFSQSAPRHYQKSLITKRKRNQPGTVSGVILDVHSSTCAFDYRHIHFLLHCVSIIF